MKLNYSTISRVETSLEDALIDLDDLQINGSDKAADEAFVAHSLVNEALSYVKKAKRACR